jgi:threonine dehydrogenase-like Zn-dependent dehydrogenase
MAMPTRFRPRRRGLKIKFVRRMGDDFPRAIDLVSSDRVNVRALVTHRESLNAAPELFEARISMPSSANVNRVAR